MKILVTGGAGFIGSAVIRKALSYNHSVVNVDALTYASNEKNLLVVGSNPIGGTKFLKSFRLIVFKAIFFKLGENL